MVEVADAIAEATERLARRLQPARIILFGSRARGDARAHSDLDLLLVLSGNQSKGEARREASDELRGLPVAYDLIIATPEEIARRGNLVGSIYRPALREGIVLYDGGGPLERREVSEADVRAEVQRMLDHAEADLEIAQMAMEHETQWGNACYHSQQAVEKALKTVFIFLQQDYLHTHELKGLLAAIPEDWPCKSVPIDAEWLSKWVIYGRYPDGPEADEADAQEATRQAGGVLEAVRRDLLAHGFEFRK